jgi:outer membrane protein TolC
VLRFILLLIISSKIFANYSLEDLVEITLENHSQINVYHSKEQSALEGINNAKSKYYPTLSLNYKKVDADSDDVNYFADDEVTRVNVHQVLYTGGLVSASIDEAKNNLELTRLENKANKFELVDKLINLYVQLFNEQNKHSNYINSYQIYQDLKNTLSNKLEIKLIANSQYQSFSEKLENLEYNIKDAKLNIDNLLTRINILTSLNLSLGDIIFIDNLEFYNLSFERFYNSHYKTLQKNTEIKILDAKYNIANSELMPKVNLSLEHQKGNFSNKNFGEENRVFLDVIYNFSFENLGENEKSLIDKQTVKYELKALKQELESEFNEKYTNYKYLQDKIILINNRVEKLEQILHSKKRLFASGKTTWQDLLGSIDTIINTKNNLSDIISQKVLLGYYFYYLMNL